MQRPPPLREGSLVHVVAPSSPFDRDRFDNGLPFVKARYQVKLGDSLFAKAGFLAGDDAARLADLEAALSDAQAAALIAARGGYGATRLLPSIDVERVRRANKWLVGFSDVTALHAVWARAGLCSIHGPMVASIWEAEPRTRDAWCDLLEGLDPRPMEGLERAVGGRAEGRLFGGNLTVLTALVGTPYMPSLDGAVLALEDVTERPYRIDRMLTTLLESGVLRGVRAFVLGQFTECNPGPDGTTVEHVLVERLDTLGVPIVRNAPFGHVPDNHPLLFGATAQVDADAGTVTFRVGVA